MAQNKNALIRYKTIDKCLQNNYQKWSLLDLIEACSDALYEYEGKDVTVSKRTIQLDIQLMRSDKLGYNAPIVVYERKYYKYEDPNYTITDIPITETDMNVLSETVEMLKQFKNFSLFSELDGIIQRLEDKVYTEKNKKPAIIHLDKNEKLKGLAFLDVLYQSILKEMCLRITYQSFKARVPSEITLHPYILKQFNNRWFVVGQKDNHNHLLTLALDRIIKVDYELKIPYKQTDFDGDEYYKNTIGVTVLNEDFLKKVVLKINKDNAPYILTKPLHHSQKLIEKLPTKEVIIEIYVHLNKELERLILGFGDSIEVLSPRRLRKIIKNKVQNAAKKYSE